MDNREGQRNYVWFTPAGVFYSYGGVLPIRWEGTVAEFVSILSRPEFTVGDCRFYVQAHNDL